MVQFRFTSQFSAVQGYPQYQGFYTTVSLGVFVLHMCSVIIYTTSYSVVQSLPFLGARRRGSFLACMYPCECLCMHDLSHVLRLAQSYSSLVCIPVCVYACLICLMFFIQLSIYSQCVNSSPMREFLRSVLTILFIYMVTSGILQCYL